MTSSANAEPKGSEPSSTECRFTFAGRQHCFDHIDRECCGCGLLDPSVEKPKPCTCGPDEACGDPCDGAVPEEPQPRCEGCGHTEHSGFCRELTMPGAPGDVDECGCLDDREPPMTPEEEEEAPEDRCTCGEIACESELCDCDSVPCPVDHAREAPGDEGPKLCYCGIGTPEECENGPAGCGPNSEDPKPPQPDRRPPYAVAYSVQGHLYEVALPGDASVQAVEGALVIQHALGPVAGIVQVLPVINEEKA